ncbi:MAG: adenylate/guanylate cyclase domain-containing protein [Armatimonadota bacterium]
MQQRGAMEPGGVGDVEERSLALPPAERRCGDCGAFLPGLWRFCGYCGVRLLRDCAGCGGLSPLDFRFCGHCGTPLGESAALPAPAPPGAASRSEERRRATILFADLTGSTALTEAIGTESAYRVVSRCLDGLGRLVTEAGGYVVKTLGDGLMALFGAPVAHGDDPQRAATAALRMQEWMETFATEVREQHGLPLRLRVGINYGSVVAAPLSAAGRAQYDVLGDAVNVAQRLEAAAEPGTVCASRSFYELTRGRFEFEDRGSARVKGKSEALRLYRLLRARPREAEPLPELPLVGRDAELEAIRAQLRRVQGGGRGLAVLEGPAGIGKSRLLDEVARELAELGVPALRASGEESSAPFALWRRWILEQTPVEPEMPAAAAAEALRSLLPEGDAAWAPWLAALAIDPGALASLEPEAREAVLREALHAFVRFRQAGGPAALLIDEAGALDGATLASLLRLSEAVPGLLLLLAARHASQLRAAEGSLPTTLRLGPLPADAAGALVERALPEVSLPPELRDAVLARAGGSPLLLDLTLRAARTAADPLEALRLVPDDAYGLVRAELDTLSPGERAAADAAAVLGRSFEEDWLAQLDPAMLAAVPRLEGRSVLVEQNPPPRRELAFRLGAVQEVLYEGLLSDTRRATHARAAAVLSARAEARPELAARAAWHWRAAEAWEPALRWTLRAAEQAASLFAQEEARALFGHAREIAHRLEHPREAARCELEIGNLEAHAARFPEAQARYAEAERALDGTGPEAELPLARVLLARARLLARTGETAAAVPHLDRALALLQACDDPEVRRERVHALVERAHECSELGELDTAQAAARDALQEAEASGWGPEEVAARSALGRICTLQGAWPAAERELSSAARLSEELSDWPGASACWTNLGAALKSSGRWDEAARALDRAHELAERTGEREKAAIIRLNLGTLHLSRGDWPQAETAFREALARFREMGHGLGTAAALFNLAECCYWSGASARAAALLPEAETAAEGVDFPYLGIHLRTLAAELQLANGAAAEAADAARSAREAARELGYRTGEGLAGLTLGRALLVSGEPAAAREALREALEQFDAGEEPLERARTQLELARAHAALGEDGAGLEQEAATTLRSLGAEPWLRLPDG